MHRDTDCGCRAGAAPLGGWRSLGSARTEGGSAGAQLHAAARTHRRAQAPNSAATTAAPTADKSTKAAAADGKSQSAKPAKAEAGSAKAAAPAATETSASLASCRLCANSRAVDVSRVDFRVGLITTTVRHPDAEKLYLETGAPARQCTAMTRGAQWTLARARRAL